MPNIAAKQKKVEPSREAYPIHFFKRGEEIKLKSSGLWQIQRGFVLLNTLHANGDEVLLGWAKPTDFLGRWFTRLEVSQAKACSHTSLHWITLLEVENSPRLKHLLMLQAINRLRQGEALLAIAGLRRVEERLQHLLRLLHEDIGQEISEGVRLPVRLTHQHLANAIGTTRVTITRLLGEFQRRGELTVDEDRHLILKNVFCPKTATSSIVTSQQVPSWAIPIAG